MKKLDLHIHTIQTLSDRAFSFSVDKLKEYVKSLNIDGIAITNHNSFDLEQYKEIRDELSDLCVVLPGVEINVGKNGFGHFLDADNTMKEIHDIRKEDILRLLDFATDSNIEFEMDNNKADIQNEAHRIIYSRLYGKFKELLDNKNRFIDESEALYKDAFQKYKDS